MLVLSRKDNQRIWIGNSIVLTVVKIQGGSVRLGIEAPSSVKVLRDELREPRSTEKDSGSKAIPSRKSNPIPPTTGNGEGTRRHRG